MNEKFATSRHRRLQTTVSRRPCSVHKKGFSPVWHFLWHDSLAWWIPLLPRPKTLGCRSQSRDVHVPYMRRVSRQFDKNKTLPVWQKCLPQPICTRKKFLSSVIFFWMKSVTEWKVFHIHSPCTTKMFVAHKHCTRKRFLYSVIFVCSDRKAPLFEFSRRPCSVHKKGFSPVWHFLWHDSLE